MLACVGLLVIVLVLFVVAWSGLGWLWGWLGLFLGCVGTGADVGDLAWRMPLIEQDQSFSLLRLGRHSAVEDQAASTLLTVLPPFCYSSRRGLTHR